MAEPLFDDCNAKPCDPAAKRFPIRLRLPSVLPRVKPVRPGEHLQEQRIVFDRSGHRTDVIDCQLDWHDAGVGHEPMRRLHPVDAAVCGRNSD